MKKPDIPANEEKRLKALYEYEILDTLPEKDYNDFTRLAAEICDVPIALINLTDATRQWIKAAHGFDFSNTQMHLRENSICAHAINTPEETLVVNDCRLDERFHDNPYVRDKPPIIFYAGVPLVTPEGYALGTLCTIDSKPKKISESQLEALKILGKQIINLLELRKKNKQLEVMKLALQEKNTELEEFAYVVSHDIKSPLTNMYALAQLIKFEHADKLDKEAIKALNYLEDSSAKVKNLVTDILAYYKGDQLLSNRTEEFELLEVLNNTVKLLNAKEEFIFHLPEEDTHIATNKTALKQIFINLISNAIKYNYKEKCEISIGFEQDEQFYHFSVKDNGSGIEEEDQERIFNLFTNLDKKDRNGDSSTGIGLATVKKIVNKLGGEIEVDSIVNEGTEFRFSIRKIKQQQEAA